MAHHQALVAHHLLLDSAQVLCRNILMLVTVYNHGLIRIFAQTLLYEFPSMSIHTSSFIVCITNSTLALIFGQAILADGVETAFEDVRFPLEKVVPTFTKVTTKRFHKLNYQC